MGFLSKLFRKKQGKNTTAQASMSEYIHAENFKKEFSQLLSVDAFLARSDYVRFIEQYKSTYEFFRNIQKANTLNYFCKTNNLDENLIYSFINQYSNIKDLKVDSDIIETHNEAYIQRHLVSEKEYLDNILKEIDPNIVLDEEQRRVVLSDEDFSLVIAGAGAGKTTTVAAKVRYLVEKKGVDPNQILVISFTNKAVDELKERINTGLSIDCPITTFHSSGYAILRKKQDEKKAIAREGFLFDTVNCYLKKTVLENPELVDKLILFFGSYFDAPYEGNDLSTFFNYVSKADFSTLKGNIEGYNAQMVVRQTGRNITINNEYVRSAQEVQIANFLFMNNIDYKYEDVYPYHILKAKKPYTPDFYIKQGDNIAYIEHFGITEDGRSNRYLAEELAKYKQEIKDKINIHKNHGTKLLITFSSYNDGRELLEHLRETLISNDFKLINRSSKEVFERIIEIEENKYITRFVKLICKFISNFKTSGYNLDDFYRLERLTRNVRTKLFLEIGKECYLEYQKQLSQKNCLDFQDMINDAARILCEKQIAKETLDFKYIIVDEYQDISKQRFDLTKELSKICNAKIIAVGDDWQSIYAFSGSDITLFTDFCSRMGYGKELKITKTYRNAQEVINIAGNFIQKNASQIKKSLISPKSIKKPVIIDTYSEEYDRKEFEGRGGKYFHLGKKVEEVIESIVTENNPNASILLIGRYGFDARNLCFSKDFIYDEQNKKITSIKYKKAKLEFLTAHSSKGLGYENVIIINARNEIYGFPSQIEDDPIIKLVTKNDNSIEYAEERRLFYVAMTRTKNRVYIVTPEQRPSEFILELLNDYPNIIVNGKISHENVINTDMIKKCPICGYPLQLRWKKNYGLKLWMCTNEPEICDFISNDLSGGKISIKKCDSCKDGYLIIKKNKDGRTFLGCTNYKKEGTGCSKVVSPDEYYKWLSKEFEKDSSMDKPSFEKEIKQEIPNIKPEKTRKIQAERKNTAVHNVSSKEQFIEKEGFSVITDNEGKIITDMDLLSYLRKIRFQIASREKKPAFSVISNKGLVSLATYRPESKEEFTGLYALGEKTYQSYGASFINAIKNFYDKDFVGEEANSSITKSKKNIIGSPEKFFEKDGFSVIADYEGQIITDMELLFCLRKLRGKIAVEEKKPAYVIVSNKGLVSMATYRPLSKEDFIKLYGLGEKTYQTIGEKFINAIKEFDSKKK